MKTTPFERKPFRVDAVQVVQENLTAVAEWTKGELKTVTIKGPGGATTDYVHVPVKRPLTERQTRAYVGDWVLWSEETQGFKVYTQKAFENNFEEVLQLEFELVTDDNTEEN